MPVFLMRFSYTPETWAQLMEHPEDRRIAAAEYLAEVGGHLLGFWYAFGEYDGYMVMDVPTEAAAAGVVLAITAGGAMRAVETTHLLTVESTLNALAAGHAIAYRKPGVPASEVESDAMSHAVNRG
jgi:uncharacterized protein with GYD domain